MSKTIDEKVVQMKFDNSNFEKNVARTLKTLDNLKWKITETDLSSGKGLSNLNKAAKDVDMSGLAKGIETVQARFSALQVIGVTALSNLTNSAINAGKRIVSSLGDALINGGKNRALNIQNAKFQIEGLLGTEEYQKQWTRIDQSINWAVKDTAYGYDSAARAASQFMASSVKVGEQMDYSLRAISGVAAMTNSTYDDIANVFTRVAGQGRVMAIDLNSLAARGMNAAAVLGKALGKSESEIRDMVSKGKIDFDTFAKAMDDAFGEHAKKGNETFSGALANMKAAMSRIGAKVWDPLLTNQKDVFNQMRILFNDLNNNYLDGPIKGLNDKLTGAFQNLVSFLEKGGLKNVLLGIGDILGYIGSILKPIKEGFREIFPKKSVDELVSYTVKFKEWTSQLKLSDSTATKLKDTFKGLFSVVRIGVEFISSLTKGLGKLLSSLTGVPGGILGVTQAIGNWLTKLANAIHESKIFTNVIEGVTTALINFGNKMKDFFSKFDIFGAIVKGFTGIFNFIKQLASELGLFISTIFKTGNLDLAFKAVNAVFESGLLVAIIRFVNQLKMVTMRSKQAVGNLSGTLYALKETLTSLQYSIKASAIMEIGKAILVLAGALLVLSLIDPVKLGGALVATAVGMGELIGALALLGKFNTKLLDAVKIYALVNIIGSLSTSLVILSVALKIASTINWFQMLVSLIGLSAVLWELVGVVAVLSLIKENDMYKATKSIRKLSTSLVILSVALKIASTIDWKQMIVAVVGMSAVLWEMVLAIKALPKLDFGKRIAGLTGAAFAMVILAGALKILATMSWDDIFRSVSAMGLALAELTACLFILGKTGKYKSEVVKSALSLIPATLAMVILASSLKKLSELDWEEIKKSLIAMGLALAELTAAMVIAGNFKGFTGSMAINGLIGSLIPLAIALKMIGSMEVPQLVAALIAIATAFTILGVAGMLLSKIAPGLLAVAGAIALFGAGAMLIGSGLMLMAAGISALAVALAGGTTIIVAGLTAIIVGIINLIPSIIKAIGDGIVIICDALIAAVPKIATTVLTICLEILKALANDVPMIVKYLAEFLIGVLNELAVYLPDFIEAAFNVIKAFLEGLGKGLQGLDPILSLEGVLSLVGLTALMHMLSGLGSLVGPAAIGVLALGALIAELAVVLAAIGGLAQIPGLKWLVEEGGNFMQAIGTAIGQLIGGIIGGVALGASAALPQIGQNLSDFMETIQPFINGCRVIDQSVLAGAAIISAAIIMMSSAELFNGITSFLTIGHSMGDMGTELSDFMNNAQGFVNGVKNIDASMLGAVSALAKAIIILTAADLLQGITKFMTFGQSGSLSKFGEQLPPLAKSINGFVSNLGSFGDDKVKTTKCAAEVLVVLSQAASKIPNSGGIVTWFTGDNDISEFGDKLPGVAKNITSFLNNLGTFSDDKVAAARCAAEVLLALAQSASEIPNTGGMASWFSGDNDIGEFSEKLPGVGHCISKFVESLGTFGNDQVNSVKAACDALVSLAQSASQIPNTGGMGSWFSGDNDIGEFGDKLPDVGTHIKDFVDHLGTFGDAQVATVDAAGRALKTLCESASQIPNTGGIGSWFTGDNDIGKFGDKLPGVGTHIREFVDHLGTFGDAQVATVDAAGRALKALSDTAGSVPRNGGLFQIFTGDNDISQFANKFPGLATNLVGFVTNLGTFSDEQVQTIDAAGRAIKALASAANEVPNTGGMISWFMGDNDISQFANKFPGIGTNLQGFVTNLGTFSDDQVKTVDAAGRAIKALASAANEVPNTGGIKSWFVGDNDISQFANKFWDVGSGLNAFIRAIGTFGDDQLKTVSIATQALGYMADMAGKAQWNDDAPEKLKNMTYVFWDVGAGINKFVEAQKSVSMEDVQSAAEKLKAIINSIELVNGINMDNMNNLKDCLAKLASDSLKSFYETIKSEDSLSKVRDAVQTFIQAFIDKIEESKPNVNNKAKEIMQEAYNGLKDDNLLGQAANVGKFFVQGFADGITNNRYLARDAASEVGRKALEAAKQSIDSNSPSKETFKLGTYFDQGFANGIIKYTTDVYSAAKNLGTRAKSGLSNAIAKVSDILDSDMDTQPTIRPVFDLSEVTSGVGALNSMLNGSSYAVIANVGAISSNFRGRNQNGNTEVVSAIDKLRKDLGGVKGDTYVIDGITYDDGSEVQDAVSTLIRAARIERRT